MTMRGLEFVAGVVIIGIFLTLTLFAWFDKREDD